MARSSLVVCLSILALALIVACNATASAKKKVGFYELKKGDFSVKVTNWGATIVSVVFPDSKGKLDDVILGYDTLAPYISNPPYFGALIGRVANRIAGAQFTLNGKVYKLPANNGNNTLHGGHRGFSHVIWSVTEQVDGEFPYITLYYHSFDGEQGFPGALDVFVTYKISGPYELSVIMRAKSLNKATPVNLASHGYWNLGGQNSGTILSETVQIFASKITPVNDELIPTGQITSIKGTPYDFLTPKTVGSQIGKLKGGYDINYVLDNPLDERGLRKVAVVKDGKTGRGLQLWTNQPGVQFYTANTLEAKGKGGFTYGAHAALCLETQGFPDSVNHPNFPSQIVNPGQEYKHDMLFKFSF